MKMLNSQDVVKYVEENISTFHKKKIDSLEGLRLDKILKRKMMRLMSYTAEESISLQVNLSKDIAMKVAK